MVSVNTVRKQESRSLDPAGVKYTYQNLTILSRNCAVLSLQKRAPYQVADKMH